jgi:3-oxoacyl-[acyl-carrier-protein] synthase II
MKIYIRSTANISPQKTFGNVPFLSNPVEYIGNRLHAIEPDYTAFIDAKLIRRMSRIIKMGVAAALQCLKDADELNPDAIITGTAYGCMKDSETFLTRIIEQKEEMLSPTSFIQSTHNTVAAQIALMLQCHNYNNTFVHRGFSFESALLDAIMMLRENEAENILVGSIDEITDISHQVLSRGRIYKRLPVSNLQLFSSHSKGTIAGEGAAFFLFADKSSENDYAVFDALITFYKPKNTEEIEARILAFLKSNSIELNEIDLIISGRNGDIKNDETYNHLATTIFKNTQQIDYKHLCGEYPTAASFAVWLAANIAKTQAVPAFLQNENFNSQKIKRILIYNHYQNIHHSLFLISAV